jgi:hypothetical protein
LSTQTQDKIQKAIAIPNLPLAVYLEMASHLQQIPKLTVTILPQQSEVFDYYQSQIGGLLVEYSPDLNPTYLELLEEIILFYQQK